MKTDGIISEYQEIIKQLSELDERLGNAIIHAIEKAAEYNPFGVETINEHPKCFTIKVSQVIGRPLTPSFYNFKESAKALIEILEKKAKTSWVEYLESLLSPEPMTTWIEYIENLEHPKKRKKDTLVTYCKLDDIIYIRRKMTYRGNDVSYQIPVSTLFIRQILKELK